MKLILLVVCIWVVDTKGDGLVEEIGDVDAVDVLNTVLDEVIVGSEVEFGVAVEDEIRAVVEMEDGVKVEVGDKDAVEVGVKLEFGDAVIEEVWIGDAVADVDCRAVVECRTEVVSNLP